jgi:putative salt-induced outer membrane protein YdiY
MLGFKRVFAMTAGVLLAMTVVGHADSLVLKNGDHLTGTVNQLAGGKLTLTTSYAGALTISWDEVTEVKLDKPLLVPVEDKVGGQKMEVSAIERTSSGFVVTTAEGPKPVAGLTTLRTAAAQEAYEAMLHPGWGHGWLGSANVSFAIARGNSETTSLGTGINLARPTRTDKTSLYYNTVYSHDGILNATTADETNAGLRYDHNVNPRLFTFATTDFAVNVLQDLDLRTVLGGGFGWHAMKHGKQQLDVFGGVVWTHENYSAIAATTANPEATPPVTNSFIAADFGEQYTRKLGATSSFTEQAYLFPDLQDTSQFRSTVNAGLSTRINSFLTWQTSFSDVYVTNPQAGTKGNDILLTTGLGISFTRK